MMTSAPVFAAAPSLLDAVAWLSKSPLLVGLSLGFAFLGVTSLLALPFLVARIPADYFTRPRTLTAPGSAQWLGRVIKNLLGWLLLLIGVAMLILPGQGLLTIFAALILIDFPGKQRFERWFIQRPQVLRAMNSLRKRAHRPPFEFPSKGQPPPSEPRL